MSNIKRKSNRKTISNWMLVCLSSCAGVFYCCYFDTRFALFRFVHSFVQQVRNSILFFMHEYSFSYILAHLFLINDSLRKKCIKRHINIYFDSEETFDFVIAENRSFVSIKVEQHFFCFNPQLLMYFLFQ